MLENAVAVVTGGGRGLGRAEALELARHGASVVVNDLGTELDGTPTSEHPAQQVVEEITAAGGKAVAHNGDVSNWDDAKALIDLAVDTYGDLNIVVNNAGILRDRMIFNMTEQEWDAVLGVHLKGHFCVSRWATSYWRDKSKSDGGPVYGRVVNTASEAFLGGSVGQPNYAAAKAGIAALTLSTARAMQRYGPTANAICPRAKTRMTEGVGGVPDEYAPEHVSALVAFLASREAEKVSGQVFVVYGGMVSVMAGPATDKRFDAATGSSWSAESLRETLVPFFDKRQPITEGFAARLQ